MSHFVPPTAAVLSSSLAPKYSDFHQVFAGGQGVVYRALLNAPSSAAQTIAFKIYYPGSEPARLDRELELLSTLNSTHLGRLIEHGSIIIGGASYRYMVSPYITGSSLADYLLRGACTAKTAIVIAHDVCSAIETLWEQRIVHRDLKPSNVMVTNDKGNAIVIDLGIARHVNRTDLTATGMTWGTMGYMSPEQFRADKSLTFKSDIFALSVITAEMLLGHHPTNRNQHLLKSGIPNLLPLLPSLDNEFLSLIQIMGNPMAIRRPGIEVIKTKLKEIYLRMRG